jgi:hypothetical protein
MESGCCRLNGASDICFTQLLVILSDNSGVNLFFNWVATCGNSLPDQYCGYAAGESMVFHLMFLNTF